MSEEKQALQSTIGSLLTQIDALETTLATFQPEQQDLLNHRLHQFINELGELAPKGSCLTEKVPVELIKFVDDGGNPDDFFLAVVHKSVTDNQLCKGKVKALEMLKDKTLLLGTKDECFKKSAVAYAAHVGEAIPQDHSSK